MPSEPRTTDGKVVDRLERLCLLARQAGATSIDRDAQRLLDRIREGRFHVACIGQFKRGKSTLINALLGEALLPSGVAPVTSVVTLVRFGEPRARVRIGEEDWRDVSPGQLSQFVSESQNPENHKGVSAVEVFCRSPFLEGGLCLVDTPGIGSVFIGNTEQTHSFLPHIDAAIVVIGGDPPISGDELDLVEDVAGRVEHLLFVLNKSDRLAESECLEALDFTRSVLSNRLKIEPPTVFAVSALERLQGSGPDREWPEFLTRIARLAGEDGSGIVAASAIKGLTSLTKRLERYLAESRTALLRSVEESEERLARLRSCALDAGQALTELRFLMDAEQQKIVRFFDRQRKRFVADSLPEVARQLDAKLDSTPVVRGPRRRRRALEEAKIIAESRVRAWMDEQQPIAEREFEAVVERFVGHANVFLDRLSSSGQLPADVLPSRLVSETGLDARSRYYFASFVTLRTPPVWQWVADWFRTTRAAQVSTRAGGLAFAQRLLETNANRVVSDFGERITESRRGVEGALRHILLEIVGVAEEAAERAEQIRRRGNTAVQLELDSLDAQQRLLDSIGRPT